MTDAERQLKAACEAKVKRGLRAADAVREAGQALHTLKAQDLWRDTHDSWQTYVRDVFGVTARRAHQLVEFAESYAAIQEAIGTTGTDAEFSERALRPLAGLSDEAREDAIREAVAESGGDTPTPAAIKRAASRRKPRRRRKVKPAKARVVRVAGCKVRLEPTHPEPTFRGYRESLAAAIAKLDAQESDEAGGAEGHVNEAA